MDCGERADKGSKEMTECLPMVRVLGCESVALEPCAAPLCCSWARGSSGCWSRQQGRVVRAPTFAHVYIINTNTTCRPSQYEALHACMDKNKEVFDSLLAEMKAEEEARGLNGGEGGSGGAERGEGGGGLSDSRAAAAVTAAAAVAAAVAAEELKEQPAASSAAAIGGTQQQQ
jgi:hypothetical protein